MSSTKRPASPTTASSPLKRNRPTMATAEVLPVSPDGELVVRIGGHDPEKTRTARVNLALLKEVSPVFKTMLGPHFKEGQSPNDASSPLELPDDDPNAMIDMFYLIHHKSEFVNDDGVLQLLYTCDKYKCVERFKEFWTWRLPKCKYSKAESVFVAITINDKKLFDASSEFVLRMNRSNLYTECRSMMLEAHESVVDGMATYRAAVRKEYHRIAYHFPAEACRSPHYASCSTFNENIGSLLVMLNRTALLATFNDDDNDLPDLSEILSRFWAKKMS